MQAHKAPEIQSYQQVQKRSHFKHSKDKNHLSTAKKKPLN
jgi:hypothetical protein